MKVDEMALTVAIALAGACGAGPVEMEACTVRPVPRPSQTRRIAAGVEIIGIVHWGLNTYTDREWGYGDENPQDLNPTAFDADRIVGACKAGGLAGLVVVAKHHDGFCLWPTKTTEHNISRSPFRGGKGDYVKEMEQACRRAGLLFGVYCSPWDRNAATYATPAYVETYHAQLRELLDGRYGEIFEMWFDGANGGDGYYGGAREKRAIGAGYYRFPEAYAFVRRLQPNVCIFSGESDDSDFRWPGNERGELKPNARATVALVGGFANGKYGNPGYKAQINTGTPDGARFRIAEADFPLRPGWFYHAKEKGRVKHAPFLMNRYLSSVGNGGIMNIGIAPTREGLLDPEDVRALKGFGEIRRAFFAKDVTDQPRRPFNLVDLREDVSKGELVDGWELVADGKAVLSGEAIGIRRLRLLDAPVVAKDRAVRIVKAAGTPRVNARYYFVDPALAEAVRTATCATGETDTAKWMTGVEKERR